MLDEKINTEKNLLQSASAGDAEAFSKLYHLYGHKLYSFLFRITESPEMAQDIVQNIFLKLWNERVQLTAINNFSAYIFRMAQNQAINAFKRMAHETIILSKLQKEVDVFGNNAEENMEYKEVQNELHNALKKLPPQQNLVFKLSREQGLKHHEIAHLLKISPYTVKNHLVVALRTVGEHLRNHRNVEYLFFFLFLVPHF